MSALVPAIETVLLFRQNMFIGGHDEFGIMAVIEDVNNQPASLQVRQPDMGFGQFPIATPMRSTHSLHAYWRQKLPTLARFLPPLNTPLPFPDLRCFPADAPYNLHTIDPADCRHLAHDIATLDVPRGTRWIFGTPDIPGVELTIPVTYSRKTCIAHIIDMESTQSAGDAFTMRYLSQKVARLAELCVKPGPHLGGEGRIGEKGMLALVLVGSDPPPPRGAGAGLGVVTAMGLNRTLDGVGIGGVVARGGGEGVVFEGGTGLL